MPPKNQKATSGKTKGGEETKEESLQAVLVADTFEDDSPLDQDQPHCLIPLVNVPLIEYSLNFLARSGVEEVYVYGGRFSDEIEDYLNSTRWTTSVSPFEVRFLRCLATSFGDVMRDLDQKHLMNGDFLVVNGDVVSDFPIQKALKQHKARREKDKNAIMTMLLRQTDVDDYQHNLAVTPTFLVDPVKNRCLHYEQSSPSSSFASRIEAEMLKSPELDIRQDLIDCRIDICTPDVLSLWSDNFDNQLPRKEFLFGVLKDYELNGKTFHTYIIEQHYAARVSDLLAYNSVSTDLRMRLSAANAIENVSPSSQYQRLRDGRYQARDVIIARPSKIVGATVINANSSVGSGCLIRESVVGEGCQIGKNTTVESSYIWDNATIGNNVSISKAIVGVEVAIGDDCVIGEGAIIARRANVPPSTKVPAGARVTKSGQIEMQTSIEDEDEEDVKKLPGLLYQKAVFADSTSTLASDISEIPSPRDSRSQSFATIMSDDDGTDRFLHDTVAILLQRMQEGKHAGDMQSELMGLRFGGGADEVQVRKAVAIALMKHIHDQVENGLSAADASRRNLEAFRTLVRRDNAEQSTEEQAEFLLEAQKDLSHRSGGDKILVFVVKDLYDLEIFEEDAFTTWWADPRSSYDEKMTEVRQSTAQFIEWLKNTDSDEDEDEDEDGDEDEDEEEDRYSR